MRKEKLRKSIKENGYIERIKFIQNKVKPLLSRTTNVNLDYTEHTLEHSLNIEEIYGECFGKIAKILNDHEKFLLIIATLVHDVGMIGQSEYSKEDGYSKEVRESHQYRSADFLDNFKNDLGLSEAEKSAIKQIVTGHRKMDINMIKEIEVFGIGKKVRLRLLASILKLGDELDILEDRAPELVKKYINVNKESLIYHETHEICTGIASDSESNIIIKAVASNKKLEEEVIHLIEKIKSVFNDLKDILTNNGIKIKGILLDLDVNNVIQKEICLFLMNNENLKEEEILNFFKDIRNENNVKISIDELISKNIILDNKESYSLSFQDKHFNIFLNTYLRTEDELIFTKSDYVKKYIENNFDKYVKNQFGVSYLNGDKEDRILLLTNFPTSLEYFFDTHNTPYEFGNMNRKSTLDLGLLHALSIDIIKYPEQLKGEILLAAQAININLSKNTDEFLRLCSSIPEANKKKVY